MIQSALQSRRCHLRPDPMTAAHDLAEVWLGLSPVGIAINDPPAAGLCLGSQQTSRGIPVGDHVSRGVGGRRDPQSAACVTGGLFARSVHRRRRQQATACITMGDRRSGAGGTHKQTTRGIPCDDLIPSHCGLPHLSASRIPRRFSRLWQRRHLMRFGSRFRRRHLYQDQPGRQHQGV